ncbi:MAG: hypothetical protein EPO55_01480 [Reyranella sp.]|uniref:hypothetical protein n=1 Tax=Reyranella sp. TaxID=1929291 RepID=UPI0012213065|nr:hypothetical protein [Reyranella sp.]TAJ42540.1 MAG: hypothetical protein EPO55_01480 [Reyranella sp.]
MIKRFSRPALYELVWSKPMRELAAENEISDVGLVKVCRTASIPTPPRGHWNRINAGKPTYVVDLPPRPPGLSDEVTFGGRRYEWQGYSARTDEDDRTELQPPVFDEELSSVLGRIRKQLGKVTIPKTLANPHHLIERLLEADERRRQVVLSNTYAWDKPIFDGPFEKRRLRVLNAISVALDHEDYKVSIGGRQARDLGVKIGGQHVSFTLDGASRRGSDSRDYHSQVLPQFGAQEKLKLEILYPDPIPDMQWTWVDGDQKIEAHLSDIVVCLILAGEVHFRRHRQARYEWEVERLQELREKRRKEKEEAESQERLRLEREARERIQHLLQEANNWRRARDLRDYVATVQVAAAGMASEGDANKISAWVSWALAEADRIDPLQNERLGARFGGA